MRDQYKVLAEAYKAIKTPKTDLDSFIDSLCEAQNWKEFVAILEDFVITRNIFQVPPPESNPDVFSRNIIYWDNIQSAPHTIRDIKDNKDFATKLKEKFGDFEWVGWHAKEPNGSSLWYLVRDGLAYSRGKTLNLNHPQYVKTSEIKNLTTGFKLWKQFYNTWKGSREQLYGDNPGVNIDI